MRPLFFYRTVTKEIIEHCGCDAKDYSYSYKMSGPDGIAYKTLFVDTASQRLKDENDQWSIEKYGVCISREVVLSTPECLRGAGNDALVCDGGDYSLCIIWTCNSMKSMGYIDAQKSQVGGSEIYHFYHEFLPGEIGEDISLETIFYVKKEADIILPGEESCCNEMGINLGCIDVESFSMGRENFMFPCKDENDSTQPLWWLTMDIWDDATMEPFSAENVCLHFNKYYSECPMNIGTGKIKHQDVLIEIFTTAYLILFHEMIDRGYYDLIFNNGSGEELEPGSICDVLRTFVTHGSKQIHTGPLHTMERSIHEKVRESLLSALSMEANDAIFENE